jgi:hypothetical protein
MDLSCLFDDAFLSDFDLVIVSADGGGELRRFPVHGAVLAGQRCAAAITLAGRLESRAPRPLSAPRRDPLPCTPSPALDAVPLKTQPPPPTPAPSPFFKALLQSWTGPGSRLITLAVHDAAERDAAEAMLRCTYSGAPPAGAGPEQLLACMVLADRRGHCGAGGAGAGRGPGSAAAGRRRRALAARNVRGPAAQARRT